MLTDEFVDACDILHWALFEKINHVLFRGSLLYSLVQPLISIPFGSQLIL